MTTAVGLHDMTSQFEDVLVTHGSRSGALMSIAVHSTRLGPALGGARMWHYPAPSDGVTDAMRLARAMTYKAAAAGLDLGGGKGVICAPAEERPQGELRRAILLDFGDAVASLEGRYVTAEDVGTEAADMTVIAERTPHVVGLPRGRGGSGDPSPVTARGVLAAIRASLEHRFGAGSLSGRRVCIIGAGHVGGKLARLLTVGGAKLTISDIDGDRKRLAQELGASWAEPEEAATHPCDVLAPCALGGAISEENVASLRCEIVCGAANNVLADESLADRLRQRGILYAPDFIANSGGLINVYAELNGLSRPEVGRLVEGVGASLRRILEDAEAEGTTPLAAARRLALRRLRGPAVAAA
jgi:leucine dehydrogenase